MEIIKTERATERDRETERQKDIHKKGQRDRERQRDIEKERQRLIHYLFLRTVPLYYNDNYISIGTANLPNIPFYYLRMY